MAFLPSVAQSVGLPDSIPGVTPCTHERHTLPRSPMRDGHTASGPVRSSSNVVHLDFNELVCRASHEHGGQSGPHFIGQSRCYHSPEEVERAAINAMHRQDLLPMARHERACAQVQWRRRQGWFDREIPRCSSRSIAREIFNYLPDPHDQRVRHRRPPTTTPAQEHHHDRRFPPLRHPARLHPPRTRLLPRRPHYRPTVLGSPQLDS